MIKHIKSHNKENTLFNPQRLSSHKKSMRSNPNAKETKKQEIEKFKTSLLSLKM